MKNFIQDLVERHNFQAVRLLNILREVQAEFRCIPQDAVEILADLLKIERTQVISVVEFYSFFHFQPKGRYDILVSDSITDDMMGKQALMDYFSEKLVVSLGVTVSDI